MKRNGAKTLGDGRSLSQGPSITLAVHVIDNSLFLRFKPRLVIVANASGLKEEVRVLWKDKSQSLDQFEIACQYARVMRRCKRKCNFEGVSHRREDPSSRVLARQQESWTISEYPSRERSVLPLACARYSTYYSFYLQAILSEIQHVEVLG